MLVNRSRELLLFYLAVVALAIPPGVWVGMKFHRWRPEVPITEAVFHRIDPEMHVSDVERLIGVPPGDYSTVDHILRGLPEPLVVIFPQGHDPTLDDETRIWYGTRGVIAVGIDTDGSLLWKQFVPRYGRPEWERWP